LFEIKDLLMEEIKRKETPWKDSNGKRIKEGHIVRLKDRPHFTNHIVLLDEVSEGFYLQPYTGLSGGVVVLNATVAKSLRVLWHVDDQKYYNAGPLVEGVKVEPVKVS
jgi:hypothetical protein